MFLKLHYMDGGTEPAPALVNVNLISAVSFKPAQQTRMGNTYAAAIVSFHGPGYREFILAEVQDGAVVAELTPSDFEAALFRAQSQPGVQRLRRVVEE
ncbi:hypothetical protein [Pseudarthrobacter sp. J47]|uniref:hypothetical protein n=1 Tax=Pseudarthrobacter sp. J47 TaxID=3116482 RepID=UPI002E807056|nr:hypothetical protein [Pseudarthrobacter sp. J47]MEE2524527.1 hypothetical protein [Pseudarthrobacter sp. J47]